MIIRDYHGYFLDEALDDVDNVVGFVRMGKRTEECKFITGHGPIRQQVMDRLRQTYNLKPMIMLGNPGVIFVHVE